MAHEVSSADRFDLATKAVERVTVDAGEEAPVAHLFLVYEEETRGEVSAEHGAFGLELGHGRLHLPLFKPESSSEGSREERAQNLCVAPHDRENAGSAIEAD
jgi:hypothetical protein